MEPRDFSTLLHEGAAALGITLGEGGAERLFCYFRELLRWAPKVNLISRSASERDIVDKHFLDSLAVLRLLEPGRDRLLDVGSGAGFPGLVCKAACPELAVELMEPRLKRVSFLRQVIRHCGLGEVPVLARRLEEPFVAATPPYDFMVSRAVADLAGFLKMCDGGRAGAGKVICMKGPRFGEELEAARGELTGWRLETVDRYLLPVSGTARALLVFARNGASETRPTPGGEPAGISAGGT